jgi:hypothetical protein
MITVTAALQIWSNEEGSSHFLVLPDDQAVEVRLHSFSNPRGFGSVRVGCTIGEISWKTSLFPRKSGGYFLPVKIDVCRRAGIAAGDEVSVELEML